MRRMGRLLALPGAVGLAIALGSGAATASVHHSSQRPWISGANAKDQPISGRVASRSIKTAPRGARFLRPAAGTARVTVTVSFKPRDRRLLDQLAANAAGHPGLPIATLRRLFAPPPQLVSQTSSYLHRFGFTRLRGGILTETYGGTVAESERAFHTTVSSYRKGRISFRSPSSELTIPASIAQHVQLVSGLDTYPLYRPMTTLTPCSSATDAQSLYSAGLTAQQLASSDGYDAQPLLDAGDDGTGQVIDFVEYATYNPSDITDYESCYGAGMTGPVSQINVAGGTTNRNGEAEVELDDEAALSLAPGISHIYNYAAPGSEDQGQIIDHMLSDQATTHVTEISTSWGACEPYTFNGEELDTHYELQITAAFGLPVFAASGDSGTKGCLPNGLTGDYTTFPASDTYATAVGGTTLNLSTVGADHETAWGTPQTSSGGASGGGISMLYPMPSWQTNTSGVITGLSSSAKCGQFASYCRQLPDVSLDANTDTGSLIDCVSECDTGIQGWQPVGGTSEAAPMLAALVADADEYSLGHGGKRLGFASRFFYQESGTSLFHDVTSGSNGFTESGHAFSGYAATSGYDMATGLGTIDANQLATDVTDYTSPSLGWFDNTTLSSGETRTSITPGRGSTLTGVLTNNSTHLPMVDKSIVVSGFFTYRGRSYSFQKFAVTDGIGRWSVNATTKDIGSRLIWQAVYPGGENLTSSVSPAHYLYVRPKLALGANTTHSRRLHAYIIYRTRKFNVLGAGKPILRGFHVTLQHRTARRWHSTRIHPTVGRKGGWTARIHIDSGTKIWLRWTFKGSASGEYLSAKSPGVKFIIRTPG
jgi:subtilase family serine protease